MGSAAANPHAAAHGAHTRAATGAGATTSAATGVGAVDRQCDHKQGCRESRGDARD
jgi:hypothetical protein